MYECPRAHRPHSLPFSVLKIAHREQSYVLNPDIHGSGRRRQHGIVIHHIITPSGYFWRLTASERASERGGKEGSSVLRADCAAALPLSDAPDSVSYARAVSKDSTYARAAASKARCGGGREATRDGGYEFYETDDSVVSAEVSDVLRRFLPRVFPGRFDEDERRVEIEWVRVLHSFF